VGAAPEIRDGKNDLSAHPATRYALESRGWGKAAELPVDLFDVRCSDDLQQTVQ